MKDTKEVEESPVLAGEVQAETSLQPGDGASDGGGCLHLGGTR